MHCFLQFGCLLHLFLLSIRAVLLWNSWSGLGLASAILPDILKGLKLNSREEKTRFTITAIVSGTRFALTGWQWGLLASYSAAQDVSLQLKVLLRAVIQRGQIIKTCEIYVATLLNPYMNSNFPAMYNLKYRAKSTLCDLIEKLWSTLPVFKRNKNLRVELSKSLLSWGHCCPALCHNDQHCGISFLWKKKSLGELHLVKNFIWHFWCTVWKSTDYFYFLLFLLNQTFIL